MPQDSADPVAMPPAFLPPPGLEPGERWRAPYACRSSASRGRLIGINTSILSGGLGGGNDGIAFAVPTRIMLYVADQLKKNGEVVKLTDRERDILVRFARNPGETIARHALVDDDAEIGERTIDVQINRLRRKTEVDPANPLFLQTVRGVGYRLAVD